MTFAVPQVTVVQLLAALAVSGLQLATGTLVVVTGVQVVVVYALLAEALAAAQEETGIGPVSAGLQVVVVYWFSELAVCGVQLLTAAGPVVTVEQEMVPPGVQLGTGVVNSVAAS